MKLDARTAASLGVQARLANYARCLDNGELEKWPGLFSEQCLYKVTSAENHRRDMPIGLIYADSRAMLQDRVSALREANIYEGQSYRHVIGPTTILNDPGAPVLEAETSFVVVRTMRDGQTLLFASGRYLDRVEVSAEVGAGLFREKIVVCDSSRVDTLLALPL